MCRKAKALLLAVLAFQLAIGMYVPIARAASLSAMAQSSGAAACPEHAKVGLAERAGLPDADVAHPPSQQPPLKHDCCRSAGCQCHCSYSPAIADFAEVRAPTSSSYPLATLRVRLAATRPGGLFRPPIA
jgi:hypothetical protein